MSKKKGKSLDKRIDEFDQLKHFSHEVISFNNHFHFRILAANGETIDYFPVSEKYTKSRNCKSHLMGFGNLIEYLNKVS